MVSLKKAIIFGLLFLIVISTQNTIALTYLPDSTHYSGIQYLGAPGDWVRVEFAVYDNYGAEFNADYELPWTEPGEFVYAYQVINDVTSDEFIVNFFSIYGIGENAIASTDHIGSVEDDDLQSDHIIGQEPGSEWLSFNGIEEGGDPYFSSAHWAFDQEDDSQVLDNGKHSYFLLVTSDQDYRAGTYNFNPPQGDDVPVPGASAESAATLNPEPCTLALFGLGSVLLLKKQRKKITERSNQADK
jgi:hypothetical protein